MSNSSDAMTFVHTVERAYAAITALAQEREPGDEDKEPSLGGKLLFVGGLDEPGRALAVAANIAGAATLAATADPDAQKHAVRDSVVDFLVTSLDEALRILKNEIRKRGTVAVCVAASPLAVKAEMIERGVLPDLVFAGWEEEMHVEARNIEEFAADSQRVRLAAASGTASYLSWQVEEFPIRWMPKLDAIARDFIPANSWAARWLRLAGRYCGRPAQGVRVLRCDSDVARRLAERISDAVRQGEVGVQVLIQGVIDGRTFVAEALPPAHRLATD